VTKVADDNTLFRHATADVRRLDQDRIAPHRRRRAPVPEQTLADARAVLGELLTETAVALDVETGEELCYARPGVQRATLRKLRRGQYVVQAELDLHGYTVPEAHGRLGAFLRDAHDRGWRCVRVIHGKGRGSVGKLPVLKGKVNRWLQQRNDVLAFCSARPADGGTGAAYVLLRRA
jgi:DNA-nicking Smr family endonuclease